MKRNSSSFQKEDHSLEDHQRPSKSQRSTNTNHETRYEHFPGYGIPTPPSSDSETQDVTKKYRDSNHWKQNKLGRVLNPGRQVKRQDLIPGRLIWAPWHVTAPKEHGERFLNKRHRRRYSEKPARNTWREPEDPLVEANYAIICSKRRMFCVYYTSARSFQAFPMYTHHGKGLDGVEESQRPYRIPVRDRPPRDPEDDEWKEPSDYHKAVVKDYGTEDCQMGENVIIDYTVSYPIEMSEYIEVVGKLTDDGIDYVIRQHEQLRAEFAQPGRYDRRKTVSGGERVGRLSAHTLIEHWPIRP